ncbi:MAG TPA: hypothetical protein VGR71_17805 [Nitrospira sp.]|nr:hypothetical protein [Nitrospira sp.]
MVTASTAEVPSDGRGAEAANSARGNRKVRVNALGAGDAQRFFLAKPGSSSGVPELGREFSAEPEAIVESLKTGLNYFVVSEWRGVADFSGKKPQLGREAMPKRQKTG